MRPSLAALGCLVSLGVAVGVSRGDAAPGPKGTPAPSASASAARAAAVEGASLEYLIGLSAELMRSDDDLRSLASMDSQLKRQIEAAKLARERLRAELATADPSKRAGIQAQIDRLAQQIATLERELATVREREATSAHRLATQRLLAAQHATAAAARAQRAAAARVNDEAHRLYAAEVERLRASVTKVTTSLLGAVERGIIPPHAASGQSPPATNADAGADAPR